MTGVGEGSGGPGEPDGDGAGEPDGDGAGEPDGDGAGEPDGDGDGLGAGGPGVTGLAVTAGPVPAIVTAATENVYA